LTSDIPPFSLEQGSRLGLMRVIVVEIANLVVLKTSEDCARAVLDDKVDAWYAAVPEAAFNWIELKLPAAPVFGLKLSSIQLYIAASKNTPGIDLEKWRTAYAAMEKDGTRARILASYGL
jgi:ABC-type amino acid transport substrate-binding protein